MFLLLSPSSERVCSNPSVSLTNNLASEVNCVCVCCTIESMLHVSVSDGYVSQSHVVLKGRASERASDVPQYIDIGKSMNATRREGGKEGRGRRRRLHRRSKKERPPRKFGEGEATFPILGDGSENAGCPATALLFFLASWPHLCTVYNPSNTPHLPIRCVSLGVVVLLKV